MTRSTLKIICVAIVVLGAACGPEPVRPRTIVTPAPALTPTDADVAPKPEPPDSGVRTESIKDAGGAKDARTEDAGTEDAGTEAPVDGGTLRQKLPAPDGGIPGPALDAGGDAETIDAGIETVSARPPVAGEIVIAEVLLNPTGTDAGHEWIEIVNRAAEPLDLADLRVADLAAEVPAPAGIIAPGARVVLGQSVDAGKNGGAPVTVAYGTRLALNNDAEEIRICIGTCASGVVIDRLLWKTLGAGYDGHALVVDRDASLICPATQPFGTAGDFGTPGEPDNCTSEP
jgi:hypothetical protein